MSCKWRHSELVKSRRLMALFQTWYALRVSIRGRAMSPVADYGLRYVLAWACNLFLISFLNVSGLLFFGFFSCRLFFRGLFIFLGSLSQRQHKIWLPISDVYGLRCLQIALMTNRIGKAFQVSSKVHFVCQRKLSQISRRNFRKFQLP